MAEPRGMSPASRRGRLQLVALFLVFFVPVLAALWLNTDHADWLPFGTTNHGELVRPTSQIAVAGLRSSAGEPVKEGFLRERWTLLMVTDGRCGSACRRLISDTQRVRRGLGKDMGRVQRLVVVTTHAAVPGIEALHRDQPDLQVAVAEDDWLETELAVSELGSGALFVVDPQGYPVLRYPLDFDPRGLLEDLERVLRISKIG